MSSPWREDTLVNPQDQLRANYAYCVSRGMHLKACSIADRLTDPDERERSIRDAVTAALKRPDLPVLRELIKPEHGYLRYLTAEHVTAIETLLAPKR